ncbi:MAG: FAD-binding oxidoreductase [Parvularculaceae bacterium]
MTSPTDHVDSYYAATAAARQPRPALAGDIEADVCVIGGGFSGVATALTLAERGKNVVLIEANRIGWGASGRNGGQALAGWSGEGELVKQVGEKAAEFLHRTRYRGNDIIEERIAKYAIECDYVRGAATVALNARQSAMLRAEFEDGVSHGFGDVLEYVEGANVKAHVASDTYQTALIDRRSGHLHPLNLCIGEARAAESLGVRIFEGAPVTSIDHGATPVVNTATGHVRAGAVVLAGNSYHKLANKKLGGYMLPAQTFMIATEPLGENLANEILPGNLGVCDANWVLDYFRRSADNRLLFGGRCTYSNREIMDVEGALAPRMRKVLPQLEKTRIDYRWGGVIGIPLNRVPLIGKLEANVFYVQGYSGHGVNCSHIAAEILADAVEANFADMDVFESVTHFKIPAADMVGSPMLALGMTYFRLRDALGV